jgi:hypothetical protein
MSESDQSFQIHGTSDGTASCSRLMGQAIQTSPVLAHRIAAHLNAMGVVNEAVKDAIGESGIAGLFVPA